MACPPPEALGADPGSPYEIGPFRAWLGKKKCVSAFGLADEYELWVGCGVDTDRDHHQVLEPASANVTIDSNPQTIK